MTKVKYSDEKDSALSFVMSLNGMWFTQDEMEIVFTSEAGSQINAVIEKREDVALAGQVHYHFKVGNFELRLIKQNELFTRLNGKDNSIIIASKQIDNFAAYFATIDISGSNMFSVTANLRLRDHQNRKIEYIKIKANPLKIIEQDPFGNNHKIPNLSEYYASVLANGISIMSKQKSKITFDDVYEMSAYYSIDLMQYYKSKAMGILPREVVNEIRDQVSNAATFLNPNVDSEKILRLIDEYLITPTIINRLQKYKDDNGLNELFEG